MAPSRPRINADDHPAGMYHNSGPVYKNLGSPHFAPHKLAMQYQLGALTAAAVVFVYAFLRRRRRLSPIRDVPGPANPSWIFGMVLGDSLASSLPRIGR